MPVSVRIPSYLAGFAGGSNVIAVDQNVSDVRALLKALWQLHPSLQDRVVDEQGRIRPHINIFVGSEAIRLTGEQDTPVPDGSEILIVPAVSGG
jgi:sulfur-carrier protein